MKTPMNEILGKKKKGKIDSVSVRKATNGYTVSAWDGDKDISMIAEDIETAMECVEEMFGMNDEKKEAAE